MLKYLYIFIITLFFISCVESPDADNPSQNNQVEQTPAAVIPVPDSTLYFDSVYAPYHKAIDTFFISKHNLRTFYGSVLFAENGHVIFKNSYGYANLKTKDTLTTSSTFQLASASKPFTAVSVMQLVEQGKIKLTDDIRSYLPLVPYDGITIHQLLCHKSGMSQYTHFCDSPDTIWPDKHKTIHNNEVIDIMHKHVPMINYAPGQKFYYCNTNYLLLASLVEKVSGLSFSDYLNLNIFKPLEMNNTVLYARDNDSSLIHPAKGYNGAFNPTIDIYLNGVVGDKGVYSSVDDLIKFDRGLSAGKLVSDSTFQLMIKSHNAVRKDGKNYGYGFRILENTEVGRLVFHTGWWKGFRTYFVRVPSLNQTVIVLTNVKRGGFMSVAELAAIFPKVKTIIDGKSK
ncbi:MAG: CubicO group peptidase (beta-lactamase class C family) [Parvicella sp.]|jgi:CubicO group peptidase (beta-lactamase class C family)